LLEAGQNSHVTLIDERTAESLYISGTCFLFLLGAAMLGNRAGQNCARKYRGKGK